MVSDTLGGTSGLLRRDFLRNTGSVLAGMAAGGWVDVRWLVLLNRDVAESCALPRVEIPRIDPHRNRYIQSQRRWLPSHRACLTSIWR